mgnify:CR=1 FL=1
MYTLIDTHAHMEEIADVAQAIAEAKAAGVVTIVAVGSDINSNEQILSIARAYPGYVYPALGYHPYNIQSAEIDRNLEFIKAHIAEAVAIGEIGLDYHKKVRERADKDVQKNVLQELLKLAGTHDKPALVHSRYAWQDSLTLVESAQVESAVFHWYAGTSSVLRSIVGRGYHISATPAVEYHPEHRRAVKEIPLDRLLLETDAPVVYGRGSDHEFESRPAHLLRTLSGAASVKGIDEAQLAEITTANARLFFNLPA